ncbi:Carboxypeptidase [Psidium guajava]|nr:Carboxypeptidase [Psidium guajava]
MELQTFSVLSSGACGHGVYSAIFNLMIRLLQSFNLHLPSLRYKATSASLRYSKAVPSALVYGSLIYWLASLLLLISTWQAVVALIVVEPDFNWHGQDRDLESEIDQGLGLISWDWVEYLGAPRPMLTLDLGSRSCVAVSPVPSMRQRCLIAAVCSGCRRYDPRVLSHDLLFVSVLLSRWRWVETKKQPWLQNKEELYRNFFRLFVKPR